MPPNPLTQGAIEAVKLALQIEFERINGAAPDGGMLPPLYDHEATALATAAAAAFAAHLPTIGWALVPISLSLEEDVRPLERVVVDQVRIEKGELFLDECDIDTIYAAWRRPQVRRRVVSGEREERPTFLDKYGIALRDADLSPEQLMQALTWDAMHRMDSALRAKDTGHG